MLKADKFWSFSCAHYEREGAREACLELQNSYCFNVNMLLLCCYLQQQRLLFDEVHIEQCVSAIAETDDQLKTIRALRTEIKRSNEKAYHFMLKAELAIEQQQQEVLIATVNQQSLDSAPLKENLLTYAQYLKLNQNTKVQSLLRLIDRP